MDLAARLEDANKNLKLLAAIRFKRAKRRYMQQKDYKWNGRIKPSTMRFDGCPYTYYQNINKPEENTVDTDKSKLDYLGNNGKFKHLEFQDELRRMSKSKGDLVWLTEPPNISKIPERVRFKYNVGQRYGLEPIESIELPIYLKQDDLEMFGFIDAIYEAKDMPGELIIGDFKFKHVADKSTYKNFVKTMLPDLKDITQLAIYKLMVKKLDYFPKSPEICALIYYNCLLCGEQEAENEFYFKPPLDLTEYLLDTHVQEALKFKKGIESSCTYEFCEEHGTNKVRWREWLI